MPAVSIPAPIGGWNARDSLDKMPVGDAFRLVNWVPRAGFVETRPGYVPHSEGLGGSVETLVAWQGTTGDKLIAAANGNLWDVTEALPAAAVSLGSGFTSDEWHTTNHIGRLILCNGADTPQVYDGTTITDMVASGPTIADLWGAATFKGRAIYWKRSDQAFWFASAGSFQGVLSEFRMDSQLTKGGSLIHVLTWTHDAGDGVDDYAVFVFSTGETLVYTGDDPGSVLSWSLIGRFQLGDPIGPRAHARISGTEIIVSRDGYVDLSVALQDGRYSEKSAYSAKIIRAAKDATNQFKDINGWQALLYPAGQAFIVNVPTSTTTSKQHIRETSSGGWCEFTGWPARVFVVFNERLFFGTPTGEVRRAWVGSSDNGDRIESWGIPAFNDMGSRAARKQITAGSVLTNAARPESIALDALGDFSTQIRATLTDDPGAAGAVWDGSPWDSSAWSLGDDQIPVRATWRNLSATGFVVSISVRIRQRFQNVRWYSTQAQFKKTGAI